MARMFMLILFFALSASIAAEAVTRAQFLGPYGIIRILARDFSGAKDPDGQVLFEAMNVAQKDSIMGPGKAIETFDRSLRIICANRPQIGHECSIFIHNAASGVVDSARKIMQYKIVGEKADDYGKLFKTDANGVYLFISTDGSFKVNVKPGSFEVYYYQNPAQVAAIESKKQRQADDKTLVIVNVEDTLKIAHVRNFWDSLNYASDSRKRFMGMSAVLNVFAHNNPSFRFVYLTQSTELIAGKTEIEFLKKNDFPRGEYRTYGLNFDNTSRLEVLKGLVSQSSINRVIFLSHNGNQDVGVFHELSLAFPKILFLSYLHVVYSTSSSSELGSVLYPDQTGFVTSVELLVDWQQKGLVDFTEMVELTRSLIPRILSEDVAATGGSEYSIPSFVNCDDFQWRWSILGDYQFLAPLRDHLRVRCHMQAPLAMLKKNQ